MTDQGGSNRREVSYSSTHRAELRTTLLLTSIGAPSSAISSPGRAPTP